MTTKHEIEILGLPKGWGTVAYKMPLPGEHYLLAGRHWSWKTKILIT